MANFGFSRLAVVAPYEPHWREAKSAVGADHLLQSAHCTQTLSDAIADCTLVLGTGTVTTRKPEQPVVPLPLLAPFIQNEGKNGRIALVFGPEKRGLTREDLSLCHHLVEIPTHPRQPSMNLAQAVAVCLYELATPRVKSTSPGNPTTLPDPLPASTASPAAASDLELLADVIEQTMTAVNYSPPAMRSANRHDLHLLLRRLSLTQNDAKRILGLFRRILWRLRHRVGPD